MEGDITCRPARQDLEPIARIFVAAFSDSVKHYAGHAIRAKVMADLFAICLDTEPAAFFVAVKLNTVAGYVFAPAHFFRLSRSAFRHGHAWRIARRWLTGQYGIGLRPVLVAAKNWLSLLCEARDPALASDARILSIAVHPDYQGQGIGGLLMQCGLAYLQAQGVARIRLEVRPDNAPAVHIYEKDGFVKRGETRDTQGAWLVMLKETGDDPA